MKKKSCLLVSILLILALLTGNIAVFADIQQDYRNECLKKLNDYFSFYLNDKYEYMSQVKLDKELFRNEISAMNFSINSNLKEGYAEYGKNTLTGSYDMVLREDPLKSDTTTLRQAIFHETIHRLEDINGDFSVASETPAYDERNTEYMQHLLQEVGRKLMQIEDLARKGAGESSITAQIKEMHAIFGSFRNNSTYFPNSVDMEKWFGFKFDLNAIEENYIKNSKYSILRKLFAENKYKPAAAIPASSSENGYWVLKNVEKNIGDSVSDGHVKANPAIKRTSYQIAPGSGAMSTAIDWFGDEITVVSSHTFYIPTTLTSGQTAVITLGAADGGSSISPAYISHSTSVNMWINHGGSWTPYGNGGTASTEAFVTQDNPDPMLMRTDKIIEFIVPGKADAFTAHFTIQGGSAPGPMVINYDYVFVENITQASNKDYKAGYEGLSPWAAPVVNEAIADKLTTEKVLTDFTSPITREQFCELAVLLYEKMSNAKAALPASNPFSDTTNPEILKAANLGIVGGVGSGKFAPGNNVTRQEISVMLMRILKNIKPAIPAAAEFKSKFQDTGSVDSWALDAVKFMNANDVVTGSNVNGASYINPKGNTTKEQAIAMVLRIYKKFR